MLLFLLHLNILAFSASTTNTSTASKRSHKASGTLIVYFSCTGNTKRVATNINSIIGGDLIEIIPQEPYTSADLNYNNPDSRTSRERNDETILPEISGTIDNFGQYDTVFLGYPLWWGRAPNIIRTFVRKYDFTNKNIITFSTSASTSTDSSKSILENLAPTAKWNQNYKRFSSTASQADVKSWVDDLQFTSSDSGHNNENDYKIVIACFSATGNTRRVAQIIHNTLKYGVIEDIIPVDPYSSSDLNYGSSDSRVSREHQNKDLRPAIHEVAGIDRAETIFVGYPLWWGEAPHVVYTFIEKYSMNGKTVIPFCTSASSGFGSSGKHLKEKTSGTNWFDGKRFSSGASEGDVKEWMDDILVTNTESEIKFKNKKSGLSKGAIAGIVVACVVVVAAVVVVVIVVVKKKRMANSNAENQG